MCKGIYFGDTPNKEYGNKVYKAYINLKNPFYYRDDPGRFSINFRDYSKNPEKIKLNKEKITEQLIKEGYDGVIMYDGQFVVFDPKQIKVIEKYDF